MSAAGEIVRALVNQSRQSLIDKARADAVRPFGEVRLDIDFYSKADAKLPAEDYDFYDASGRHWKGFGARWCVARYKWNGSRWHRLRRITGPLQFTDALTRLTEECARLSLKRIGR